MQINEHLKSSVDYALMRNPDMNHQKVTIEKEIFHQDILRAIRTLDVYDSLSFMGGTCLRLCYGATRLSEDLDFASDTDFSEAEALEMSDCLKKAIEGKYGTSVDVKKPIKETDTDTWKISIVTHPENSVMPRQRIHVDICRYPAIRREMKRVSDPYGLGNPTLFIHAESLQEILCDKLLAFGERHKIKNRDLWDLVYLAGRNVKLDDELFRLKVLVHRVSFESLVEHIQRRLEDIRSNGLPADFQNEMCRFVRSSEWQKSSLSGSEAPLVVDSVISDYMARYL